MLAQQQEEQEYDFIINSEDFLTGYGLSLAALSEAEKSNLAVQFRRYKIMLGFEQPETEAEHSNRQFDLSCHKAYLPDLPVLDMGLCSAFMSFVSGASYEVCYAYTYLH